LFCFVSKRRKRREVKWIRNFDIRNFANCWQTILWNFAKFCFFCKISAKFCYHKTFFQTSHTVITFNSLIKLKLVFNKFYTNFAVKKLRQNLAKFLWNYVNFLQNFISNCRGKIALRHYIVCVPCVCDPFTLPACLCLSYCLTRVQYILY
jgi:hypothetical protein